MRGGHDTSFTQNRELSWLNFNERVLEEADDPFVKPLEKLKFIEIFDSNLTEFFMIRVGSLYDLTLEDVEIIDNKTNMNQREQIEAIMERLKPLYEKEDLYYKNLLQELKEFDIHILEPSELTEEEYKEIEGYFDNFITPILSPQIVDSFHPFPHLVNKDLYVVLRLRRIYGPEISKKVQKNDITYENKDFIGIITVPNVLPSFYTLSSGETRFILTEKIVHEFAAKIFEHYEVRAKSIIRVTRNGDVKPDDVDFDFETDYKELMTAMIKKRNRLQPVRLEVEGELDKTLQKYLLNELQLSENKMFICQSPLAMGFVYGLIDSIPGEISSPLLNPPFKPQLSNMVNPKERIMDQVKEKDIFLSYPYESMEPMIRLLREAAEDPEVVSIKITIYRLANHSQIAEQLAYAAEKGKEVTALMELKARFDEENNIEWSTYLEEAGCKILYGFGEYKVHSKICLITKYTDKGYEYITQVATGNYNEKTAKLYTDFCMMTTHEGIAKDGVKFFNNMAIGEIQGEYDHIMVSPYSMNIGLEKLIDEQIEKQKNGGKGLIRLKLNSISDRKTMEKLSEASQAGVEIKMIVRGICCLLPQVKGRTENISIMSIVGRYLEHHRIYCFGEDEDAKIYISSADFMTRNLRRRLEIACPVYDEDIKREIIHIMEIMYSDNLKGRQIDSKGFLGPNPGDPEKKIESQRKLMLEAIEKAKKADVIRKAEERDRDKAPIYSQKVDEKRDSKREETAETPKQERGFLAFLKRIFKF